MNNDEPAFDMEWGLYDTKDGVWMGNDKGPKTFDDYMLARIAAEMVDVQLGQKTGRTKAKEYFGGANRLRDEKPTRMGSERALKLLENGYIN
jgi:hypothetical protein